MKTISYIQDLYRWVTVGRVHRRPNDFEMEGPSGRSGPDPRWNLLDVITHFRENTIIARGASVDQFRSMFLFTREKADLYASLFKYQGFDPTAILQIMVERARDYTTIIEWDLSNFAGDFAWTPQSLMENKYTSQEPVTQDAMFLIHMFQSRNAHIEKTVRKGRRGLQAILDALKEKYDLQDDVRASGTQLGSDVVTIPRIAAVFPSISVRLVHEKSCRTVVNFSSFPGMPSTNVGAATLTRAIACPLISSCMPKDVNYEETGNPHPVFFWSACKLDWILHRKDDQATALIDVLKFYKAGFESTAMPENSRIATASIIGLWSGRSYHPNLLALADPCMRALETIYSANEDWPDVKEAILNGTLDA